MAWDTVEVHRATRGSTTVRVRSGQSFGSYELRSLFSFSSRTLTAKAREGRRFWRTP
jgi:hypothetical protein